MPRSGNIYNFDEESPDYIRGRIAGWVAEIEKTQQHARELMEQLDAAMAEIQRKQEGKKSND